MATDTERRVRTQGYVDDVVRSLTTPSKGSEPQFVWNNVIVQVQKRTSADGVRWTGFQVGRLYEYNGEPAVHQDLRVYDLRSARVALKMAEKAWIKEYRLQNPRWWSKLGKLIGLR